MDEQRQREAEEARRREEELRRNPPPPEPLPADVQTLMEMGFSRGQSEGALATSGNDLRAAIGLLLGTRGGGAAAAVDEGDEQPVLKRQSSLGGTERFEVPPVESLRSVDFS